ncbi:MAG: inositol monophosphatase family protein, partial [Anaerolineales bacterium]
SHSLRQPQSQNLLEKVLQFVRQVDHSCTPATVFNWIDYGNGAPQERYWTLDPIDGTKGFMRGDQYAIALALIIHHQVQIGVLGCPKLNPFAMPEQNGEGAIFIAVRGQGSWSASLENPSHFERLFVSTQTDPSQARLLRSFESAHTNTDQIDQFTHHLGIVQPPIRMDSQAKYAVLAAGHGELMMRLLNPAQPNYHEKIWDQAAGSILIEEAGGQISDISGKPLEFNERRQLTNNQGILATNRHLHSIALQALSAIGVIPQ